MFLTKQLESLSLRLFCTKRRKLLSLRLFLTRGRKLLSQLFLAKRSTSPKVKWNQLKQGHLSRALSKRRRRPADLSRVKKRLRFFVGFENWRRDAS